MDNPRDLHWSPAEKKTAHKAFKTAYERECRAISAKLKEMMAGDSDPNYIWRVHDYLSEQRRDVDRKYDYRYSVLIQVFARLFDEGWLSEDDLSGLSPDKIQKIRVIASLISGET
jgi:hypothetical protein